MTFLRSRLIAVVSGMLAAALLVLAVPRLIAAVTMLPSAPALDRLQSMRPVPTHNIERLIRSQRRALVWQPSGRTWTDLGLAQLLLAERSPDDDAQAMARFEDAHQALVEGLSAAPANPFAWSRLAYAEAVLDGWTPQAISSLRMAFITGPFEPRLLWPRLRLSLSAWPAIPLEDQEMVLQQLRQGWEADPEALATLVTRMDRIDIAKLALSNSAADLRDLELRLRAQRP